EDAEALRNVSVNDYKDILTEKYDDRFQPALYDVLINRAINFYRFYAVRLMLQQTFAVDDVRYFADAESFAGLDIQSPDTMASSYLVLKTYRKILRFHRDDVDKAALIYADCRRLAFVREQGVYQGKEKLYENALIDMSRRYESVKDNAIVLFELATFYSGKGDNWRYDKTDGNRSGYVKARELAERIKKDYPGMLDEKADGIIRFVKDRALEVRYEPVQLPDRPFLSLVKFRNINILYQTVYKLTKEEALDYSVGKYRYHYRDDIRDFIRTLKSTPVTGEIKLPETDDHQHYTTEIKTDPLNKGFYLVFFSDAPNPLASEVYNISFLQISGLTAADRMVGDTVTVIVTDRESGAPIQGAMFSSHKNILSDRAGLARFKKNSGESYYDVRYGNDCLLVFGSGGKISYTENQERISAVIFTDRAVYRPGQTVLFKAVLYRNFEDETKELLKNHAVNMRFRDANRQIIAEQNMTVNDFGSVSGSFSIPQGLLNGYFTVECGDYGSVPVQVEEYKRPAFEVKFDTVRENYKLNDHVEIFATAKAFAGYAIDGAGVQYRVVRKAHYRLLRRWYPPGNESVKIAGGNAKTDQNGKITVAFQALAGDNEKNVKTDDLIYTYTVEIDVTDMNGETQTATIDVNIGNIPLLIKTNIPEKMYIEQTDGYTVETTNLNGNATPATVNVQIVALKSPEKILRKRLWNDGIDLQTISEAAFRRDFPADEYGDELNPFHFPEKHTVTKFTIDTEKTKTFDLSALKDGGFYKLILKARNRQGISAEDTVIFHLADGKSPEKIASMDDWLTAVKKSGEPGENVEIFLAGGNDESYVYCEIIHKNKLTASEWIKTGTKPVKFTFPIEERHRGGFIIQFNMVQNNRIYTATQQIHVPFTNKMLDVKLATFRDRLLPGESEKWTMLVSDKKGGKQIAEVVASLYDASLDAIAEHSWTDVRSFYNLLYRNYYIYSWSHKSTGRAAYPGVWKKTGNNFPYHSIAVANINWFDGSYRTAFMPSGTASDFMVRGLRSVALAENKAATVQESSIAESFSLTLEVAEDRVYSIIPAGYGEQSPPAPKSDENFPDLTTVQTRANFNETAFFYPHLRTGENGEVMIEFVMPEALTRWKLLSFAHTKDLKIGTYTNELITQKKVAVSANMPRFFRENDEITLTAKVNSLTETSLEGQALLRLYDAVTMQPADNIITSEKTLFFHLKQGQSAAVTWKLKIPEGIQALAYKITAQAGAHSDGEEKTVPVLPLAMSVTESLPFTVRAGQTRSFVLDKLVNNKSKTLRHNRLTVEYTSAPAWYAVLSLPHIMEYPYECAEQTFARYYANALATAIINKTPRLKQIFDTWNMPGSDALLSSLEKNRELKQTVLEETPWVMQAKSETESRKRLALLFDLNRMSGELNRTLNKLEKMQNTDGGFPWFEENPSDRYITQHIIAGIAHLDKLGATRHPQKICGIVAKGLHWLDSEIRNDYAALIRNKADLEKKHISPLQIHYLYACSFDAHRPPDENAARAFDFLLSQTEQFWTQFSTGEKALAALILNRYNRRTTAEKIIASLREHAQHTEDAGMYWKDNIAGYAWYQAPVETQAILMEAFREVAGDEESTEKMKIWLLRNKQTNAWNTTKATTEAIYALLMSGSNLLDESKSPEIKIAGKPLHKIAPEPLRPEPGTGYAKTVFSEKEITSKMGNITVENPNNSGIAYGGIYWQYFERMDKITSAVTALKMTKQLFLRTPTDKGEVLTSVNEKNVLHPGDRICVRIELQADRDYEYVHLKDMRASGLEPVGTVSGHRRQDGLWYFESIKDASNNYFITFLPRGTYVFEYDLRVTHPGNFSNGITTFQCMYAPEFSAHSEGTAITVK
ncbi:MAG: hypothetical protein LBR08_10235, partial [Bacteroidales bacterium]|nr:hypothetical protein [Bacteroidales bacterium]